MALTNDERAAARAVSALEKNTRLRWLYALQLSLVAALFLAPSRASAAPPVRGWDPSAARGYPILRVYTCPTEIAAQLGVDTSRVEAELVEALDEWFVGGGADVRMAYFGALPAGHAACTDFGFRPVGTPGPVPEGTIVITAQPEVRRCDRRFNCTCHPSDTQVWTRRPRLYFGADPIYAARVVLARGQSCNGSSTYPWPTAPGVTAPPVYNFTTTFLHELGHALGFVDDDAVPSVMNTAAPVHTTARLHLTRDDVAGLRSMYGPLRSLPKHTTAALGSTVFIPQQINQPEPRSNASLGMATCYGPTLYNFSQPLFVASTDVDWSPTGTVTTFVTGSSAVSFRSEVQHGPSNLAPAVACGNGAFLLARVDPDGQLIVSRSTDTHTFVRSTLPAIPPVGATPSIAFASWNGAFVMIVSDRDPDAYYGIGVRRFLVSLDNGVTFTQHGLPSGTGGMGIGGYGGNAAVACLSSTQRCITITSRCATCGTLRGVSRFDASTGRLIDDSVAFYSSPGSFGRSLAVAGDRLLMLNARNQRTVDFVRWLDSAEEIVGPNPVLGTLPNYVPDRSNDWHRPISDSLPSVTFDASANRWMVFYTANSRYSSEYVLVP